MGKGERGGRRRAGRARAGRRHHIQHRNRRRRRHHHHHHRSSGGTIRILGEVVAGTETQRLMFTRTVMLSMVFCIAGFVLLMSGVLGVFSMLYTGITLICLGVLTAFWAWYLFRKLKLAEASATSNQVEEPGLNIVTIDSHLSNSMPNVNAQPGINSTVFTIGSEHALSSSMPNVAAPAFFTNLPGTPYQNPPTMDVGGALYNPTSSVNYPGVNANQISPPPSYDQYGLQSTAITSLEKTDETVIEMEPPPPSYEDAIK